MSNYVNYCDYQWGGKLPHLMDLFFWLRLSRALQQHGRYECSPCFHRNHAGHTLSLQPARRMSMFGWTLILYLSLTGHYILRCIISSNKHSPVQRPSRSQPSQLRNDLRNRWLMSLWLGHGRPSTTRPLISEVRMTDFMELMQRLFLSGSARFPANCNVSRLFTTFQN